MLQVDDIDAAYHYGVQEESLVAVQRHQRGSLWNIVAPRNRIYYRRVKMLVV